jgi:hypothetical protein
MPRMNLASSDMRSRLSGCAVLHTDAENHTAMAHHCGFCSYLKVGATYAVCPFCTRRRQ